MQQLPSWVVRSSLALLLASAAAAAGEVGFVEDFALSRDRAAALRQLIPGTEDYYYYHALYYLNTEQYDKAEALTRPWHERFGQTPRLTEIQTRAALLTYERDPQRSLAYLRNRLGLRYDHQRAVPGGAPDLPTALEPRLIARGTLRAESFARGPNLDGFEDSALDWLAADDLGWERRRALLQRLQRPDLPNLVALVAEDLKAERAPDFGAYPVHRQMTLAQLGDLLRLRPELLNHNAFVQAWVAKLQPGADEDWRHDPALARAYLDRLLEFVRRLSPAHNALKAHALYQRLALDRSQGAPDKALLLEYLRLPRQRPYMAKALLEAPESRQFPAALEADFSGFTLLRPVMDDEPLVRGYLLQFLASADSPAEFAAYIDDTYLRHLFAEAKVTGGLGEPEQWASQLPPELFRQLKERVDIDFAPTNKTTFSADEPVRLDLAVKNVPALIVKVFEVNTVNFYRRHRREVDTDVNLDGLVANAETTHAYAEPPLRRVERRFEFPQLAKPGVYVIDFIGGGKSSRALVRKGKVRPLVTTGTAGQVVTVVDDTNKPVKDAVVWLGGQEYRAGDDGRVIVPFSTSPGRHPVVLSRGDFASLDSLQHQPENYGLAAGTHIDRESLLPGRTATVLVRPGLSLNGTPVSVKLLEEVRLRITSTDLDGIATSVEVPNFRLFEDRESTHEFRVPDRLASLTVALSAKVKSLTQGKPVDLSASETFALNGIAKTDKIEDLHLTRSGPDYVLELLGRTGETRSDRPVQLALKHRDFKEPVRVTLKSDGQGRVRLGALAEVVRITATGPEGLSHTWPLPVDRATYRQLVHAKAGETVSLPYLGAAAAPARDELALFEVQGDLVRADRFDALAVRDGLLELRNLPAGDYDLWLKRTGERVRVRVAAGEVVGVYLVGRLRDLELAPLKPVQIGAITADADAVTVRVQNASAFTRVHVFATRYEPEFSPFADLAKVRGAEPSGVYPAHAESAYLTGRNIGDEYRYVLDRKQKRKYPGNLLERPMLLLNPWAVRSTQTGEQMPEGGEAFRPAGTPPPASPAPAPMDSFGGRDGGKRAGDVSASLDFLADASAVLVNLVPDRDGVVRINRKEIGPHSVIQVVAVDPLNTVARTATLPEQPLRTLDLRLRAGLDPHGHFTQQKQVTLLAKGRPLTVADAAGSRFEVYDSLPRAYALYATLTADPKLAEFSFLLNWPRLKPEEKRSLYSKYACHELNFFLSRKDPAFFQSVIKPSLANKRDKTFLDHWLLGDDLGAYLDPWQYGRLNTVERVLLAQRIADEPAKTARHLNDLLRLQPPNLDRARVLFETAVQGSALDNERKVEFGRPVLSKIPEPNQPPAPPAARPGLPAGPAAGAMAPEAMPKPKAEEKAAQEAPADQPESDKKAKRDGSTPGKDRREEFFLKDLNDAEAKQHLFGDDRAKANRPAPLYRKVDVTQEWAEDNYYHLPIQRQVADLVPPGPFWLDYARHDGKGPFLSKHLADASRNFTEVMFALAVLDLPFDAGKPDAKFADGRLTFTPAGPALAYHEEVKPAAAPAGQLPILVSQNFYRRGDRFRDEDGERLDKFVTGEFVVFTAYGCQVVVTNPTPARQRLAVLAQVPVGAVPVGNSPYTRTVLLDLEPYRTQTVDYLFYFPRPGHFAHFPVQVAKNEALVAAAAPVGFEVVEKPTRPDTTSWESVSQNGSPEEVLAFLGRENAAALDLGKIAFRMRDRPFFEATVALLRQRHVYNPVLWSYGLFHNAPAVAREFLGHADQVVAECGGPIVSPLLTVDPVARHAFEHLEYKPLVNARAHALGKRRQVVNDRESEQYHRFLGLLAHRPQLGDEDLLAVTYYLLLQDRVEEAQAAFARVNPERVAERLQYDYCAAYLALSNEDPRRAREVAARHANEPVDRWRNAFAAVRHQLDEAEGKGPQVADAEDRAQQQAALAAKEPGFEFTLDNRAINLSWQNVESVRVSYYLMDVELLFSRDPFVQSFGGQFTAIKPNESQEVRLPAATGRAALPLPAGLAGRNVLVEVSAGGKVRSLPYYAGAMDVRLMESYGQLKASDAAGKPLSKVYVKVYARLADGSVRFHKDGYTDLRGRFDYASVSTPGRQPVARFAVLALSDERGALIREAEPPQQ